MNQPIRILQVVTYMGRGGLETMLMNYYRHIDRTQVQFDFLTHRDFQADYDNEIESLGGRIFRLPRLVPWSRTYKNALNTFFKTHPEYRIIHVHQDCLSSVVLKVAKKHGVSVRIAHSHNNSQDKNLKYLVKLFYRRKIPRYATDLFACSKEAGDWMFRGTKYSILNNAIETQKYKFCPQKSQQIRATLQIEDAFVVGHVGRFSPQKNHDYLIDVFSEIKKEKNNAILLLIGDGALKASIEEKVKKLGLCDSVIFTGVRTDVADLMQVMDVFVFPSRYEGLGIVAIEAQAAGLPCFLSSAVSKSAFVTPLAQIASLDDPPAQWAKSILNCPNTAKTDTTLSITSAGFDIAENAKWLQNYYLNKWELTII